MLTGAAAVAAALAGLAHQSSAAHTDCSLRLDPPTLDAGIYAVTYGEVACATVKNTIRFSISMTRDGTTTDSLVHTCHKDLDCWAYLTENDAAGDQLWCATASARVGPHSLGPVTRCSTF